MGASINMQINSLLEELLEIELDISIPKCNNFIVESKDIKFQDSSINIRKKEPKVSQPKFVNASSKPMQQQQKQ